MNSALPPPILRLTLQVPQIPIESWDDSMTEQLAELAYMSARKAIVGWLADGPQMSVETCVHCGITRFEFLGSQIVSGRLKMCIPDRREQQYTHEFVASGESGSETE